MDLRLPDRALLDLPCVVESLLPEALLAELPESTPPAPWECRVRAVVWLQRGACPLPASSPWRDQALPVTVGAVVDYLDSPVGSYREVFAGVLLRRRAPTLHVPFIAVDSLPSIHGGRANWALPKSPASFHGDVGAGSATATGDGWSVDVQAGRLGLPVPMHAAFGGDQGRGPAPVTVRGRARATRVHVAATGPTLTRWLGSGAHAGVVGSGRMVVGPPRRT